MISKWFELFFIAIVADLVTGVWAAGYEGRLKSAIMRKGLWTTISEVTALAIMVSICRTMPELSQVVQFVIQAMIFKEGVSICENLGRSGVWLPPWMKNALEIFSEDQSKIPGNIKDKIK